MLGGTFTPRAVIYSISKAKLRTRRHRNQLAKALKIAETCVTFMSPSIV